MAAKKADLQFQIDQLRQDKIIYAVESIATSLAGIIIMFVGSLLYPTAAIFFFSLGSAIALGYWIYMGFGNLKRLQKIKELEQNLNR